jgi:hypothetical protein
MKHPLHNSYIANLNQVRDYHRDAATDLTDRSFACMISNDVVVTDQREHPYCSASVAKENIELKILTLREPSLAFFLLFMEDSQRNEIAAFELGLAIQSKATIVLIGGTPRSPQHFVDIRIVERKVIRAYDYENFAAQRWLCPDFKGVMTT